MREMKDSGIEWIGQIPERWQLRRAKTLFTQRNSKGNRIEVLLSPTQKYGVVPQSQLEGVVQVKEDTDLQMFKTIHKGDFVISLRSFQGGFEYSLYEGVCSPAYQVFYPITPICDLYYRYLFKSQSFISKMNNLTVGIREGKNIQYIDFANSQIPVPPIAEQERIAAFLDAECAEIDAVLEKTRASIEEYKKLKQVVITQAVTKGVRGDRPMKDSGIEWIGEIPKEWKRTKIKMVASFFNGDRTSRYPQPADFVDDGVAFLTSRNIDGDEVNLSETKYITENKYRSLSGAKIQIDDIVFCLRGSVGKCALNRALSCGTVASSLATIRPKNIYPKYFLYFLLSNIASTQTAIFMNGTCAANLSAENVANYYIVLPRSAEQKEIADYLDDKCEKINALIAKKQQYLTEIENYKKSLIYEYVTGKKEVR